MSAAPLLPAVRSFTVADMSTIDYSSFGAAAHAALRLMAVLLGFSVSAALAQDRVDIRFKPGATSTTINGAVRGDEYIDYVVNARGGQTMVVSLAVTDTNGHGSAYFNILPAGKDYGGPYTGSSDNDRRAEITVPHDGDWAIRVYLMGNDRDTGKTVGYSIDVYIDPSSKSSGASSTTGGRGNVVEVTGVPANDILNVRSGPGTSYRIVGALGNGSQVRKLDCEGHGNSRWCEIEMMTDMRERGWVNARYLNGTGVPSGSGASLDHGGTIENRCAKAVAREVGVSANDVIVTNSTISEGTGRHVVYVGVPYGKADWVCEADQDGRVVNVFYGGEG